MRHVFVRLRSALGLVAAWAALACNGAPPPPSVAIGGETFRVEIADSPAKIRVGLMFRESMDADAGMLFVFRYAEDRGFWMRNCRFPLDMLFFDSERRLINFHTSAPPCTADPCPTYASEAPARYVLELVGGTAERLGLARGDLIEFDLGRPVP